MKDTITSNYYTEILKIASVLLAGKSTGRHCGQMQIVHCVDLAEGLHQEIKKREKSKEDE